MTRLGKFKLQLTLLAAAFLAIVVTIAIGIRHDSSIRDLELMTGLDIAADARLVIERDTHGGFLGQGFTFREFAVPSDATDRWLAKCPTHFSARTLGDSGIWPQIENREYVESEIVCVMSTESRSHQDIVVIAPGRIFQMLIDS
jgi:hypothetical protein